MKALLLTGLFFPSLAFASILTPIPSDKAIEEIQLSSAAKITLSGKTHDLTCVGAGLRYKRIAFVKLNIYVGELCLDAPAKFQPNPELALASLDQQKIVAMRITLLRDASAKRVRESFADGLENNNIDQTNPAVQEFLKAVTNIDEIKKGSTVVIVGERSLEGKSILTYEDGSGKLTSMTDGPDLIKSIFSIWLGKVGDGGLENLQKGLFGK